VIYSYSQDGENWTKLPHSFEASGLHHNALGGFLSLRIGLDAAGEGEVRFKHWTYRKI
jgi:beta-xylosidase